MENKLDNIFMSYDESIFSDGIEPMGLRIIWTSPGNIKDGQLIFGDNIFEKLTSKISIQF